MANTSIGVHQICVNPFTDQQFCNTAAVNIGGTGATVILRQIPPTPPAPANLAAPPLTNSSPTLTWDSVSTAASYNIYRDGTKIDSSTTNSYTDSSAPEGDHLYFVTAVNAGGESGRSNNAPVEVDRTPPAVGTPNWSVNPVQVGSNSTITISAPDSLSVAGEYFIGTDPGIGHGTPMTYNATTQTLTATFGAALGVGVYNIGIRAEDAAGNWSPIAPTMLVITDINSTLGITGKNKKDLVPSLAAGDIMPGLISTTQTDTADYGMTVQFKNGALDPKNDFHFSYSTGTNCGKSSAQNCHSFALDATAIAWLVINGINNSTGQFQGTATGVVDGITSTNPFTITGLDGDKLTPATNDTLILKVYAPGANPAVASPIYQASGSIGKGNGVVIK